MTLIPVNKDTLGGKKLKPVRSFAFAANVPYCEIVAPEFAGCAPNFPIVFMKRQGGYSPVAMLGLRDGENLFVDDHGNWLAPYLPALFRRYPFAVAPVGPDNQPALAIDDACDLLSDGEGEPLFGAKGDGDPSSPIGRALQFIAEVDGQTRATRELMAQIDKAGLIVQMKLGQENSDTMPLYLVSEDKLRELSDEAFLALRKTGALTLIYTHLVSLGQMAQLQRRISLRAAGKPS